MKKLIALLLVFVVVLSFAGCGKLSEKEVIDELEGRWGDSDMEDLGWVFEDDGTAYSYVFGPGKYGEYEIDVADQEIYLEYDNGMSVTFEYTYEDGEFELFVQDSEADWDLVKVD